MTLGNDTVIQECTEDLHDVPTVKYDFVPISQIADKAPTTIVGKFKAVHCRMFRSVKRKHFVCLKNCQKSNKYDCLF